jgi:predicted acylesterase/phospholipase RssA
MIKNIVISGGSVRSLAVIGCLQYISAYGDGDNGTGATSNASLLEQVVNIVGTSAGSVLALMIALGYSPSEMRASMRELMVGKGYHKLAFDDLLDLRMFDSFGLDSGAGVDAFIHEIIAAKWVNRGTNPDNVTFLDLAKRTGKNLVVCVANVSKQRSEYLCVDSTPNMPVAIAIRMSVSLPILFAPVKYNGELYVDGALYESLPIGYITTAFKDSLKDTLAIRTEAAPTKQADVGGSNGIQNITGFFNAIVMSLLTKANEATALAAAMSPSSVKIRMFDIRDMSSSSSCTTETNHRSSALNHQHQGNLFGFDVDNLNFAITHESIDESISWGFHEFKRFIEST